MKIWMKIFILTMILFIAMFYTGTFLMSDISYKNSVDTARRQAFTEFSFIASALSEDLNSIIGRSGVPSAIESLMTYYTGYYRNQDIFLGIYKNNSLISGYLPITKDFDTLKRGSADQKSVIINENGKKYLLVSSSISNDYVLIYAHDITETAAAQSRLMQTLMISCLVITIVFGVLLFYITRGLSKPILALQKVTKKITGGNYDIRVKVKGSDEVAVLGGYFNEMTDEVVAKINELDMRSRQKQQFIDNLAHEIKTPLTSIYGYAEMLQNVKLSEETLIDCSSRILYDVKRIQSMSQKLLDLALNRNMVLDLKEINICSLFERLKDEFSVRLIENDIELVMKCGTDCVIHGDTVLIENLFSNLIDNAIKASHENSKIQLICGKSKDTTVITITDEGIGISKEHLSGVFEPFYRTDFSRSSAIGGAGLGLALCKQIVDIHGAKIHIESEENIGTKIKVTFTSS